MCIVWHRGAVSAYRVYILVATSFNYAFSSRPSNEDTRWLCGASEALLLAALSHSSLLRLKNTTQCCCTHRQIGAKHLSVGVHTDVLREKERKRDEDDDSVSLHNNRKSYIRIILTSCCIIGVTLINMWQKLAKCVPHLWYNLSYTQSFSQTTDTHKHTHKERQKEFCYIRLS